MNGEEENTTFRPYLSMFRPCPLRRENYGVESPLRVACCPLLQWEHTLQAGSPFRPLLLCTISFAMADSLIKPRTVSVDVAMRND